MYRLDFACAYLRTSKFVFTPFWPQGASTIHRGAANTRLGCTDLSPDIAHIRPIQLSSITRRLTAHDLKRGLQSINGSAGQMHTFYCCVPREGPWLRTTSLLYRAHSTIFRVVMLSRSVGIQGAVWRREIHDSSSHVEARSNTSIVALRVLVGDEKGTQCLGV
jgi:hypothetical protein